jgi:hypothetical protein
MVSFFLYLCRQVSTSRRNSCVRPRIVVVEFPPKGLSAYCACKNLVSCAAADVVRIGSSNKKWGWPVSGQDKMTGLHFAISVGAAQETGPEKKTTEKDPRG